MNWFRLKHSLRLCLTRNAMRRAEYIKKHHIFKSVGEQCMIMSRKVPLYSQLIDIGDNVWIGSGVNLLTHDVAHHMLNIKLRTNQFNEKVDCIQISNNCFIGSDATIMPGVHIGENCIIGAGSIVTKDLEGDAVYGGIPAKKLGSFNSFVQERQSYSKQTPFLAPAKEHLTEVEIMKLWKLFQQKRKLSGEKNV